MKFSRLFGALSLIVVIILATHAYAHHAQYYVLDGFGGVHAGGGAPAAPAGIPYFGFDIARGIAYVPTSAPGPGVLVLDGFGGVHTAGLGNVSPKSPYFGFDIARGIVYRNVAPRAVGSVNPSWGDLSDNTVFTATSLSITAPDDGFLVVTGNVQVNCPDTGSPGGVVGLIWVNVDSTALDPDFSGYWVTLRCDTTIETAYPATQRSPHKVYTVAAGAHTVNLLVQRLTGTKRLRWIRPPLSAIFVDLGATGASAPEAAIINANPSWQK